MALLDHRDECCSSIKLASYFTNKISKLRLSLFLAKFHLSISASTFSSKHNDFSTFRPAA